MAVTRTPPPARPTLAGVDLETPVYFVADGKLTAVDPQGGVHDLGLRSEEVIGYTSESVYAIGSESEVVRFDVHKSDEGPGGPWEFERVDSGVEGPVQSAALSPDGRWLGWVDLDERLTIRDLKAGTTTDPVILPANSYLANLAQGTGSPLVSEDGDLVLRQQCRRGDRRSQPPGTATESSRRPPGDVVALMDRDDRTRIYDVSRARPSWWTWCQAAESSRRTASTWSRSTSPATTRRRSCSGPPAPASCRCRCPGRPRRWRGPTTTPRW